MDTSQPSAEMSIPEILRGLTLYTGRFPEEAVQAALSEREAITPHLLQELRAVAAAPAEYAQRKDYMLPIFTAFLLAQFREQRAYQPLLEILTAPGNTAYDLFGDTLNESMKNILGSVYDGDPVPLRAIVEDEGLDEFVRGTALATFPVLLHSGRMSREDVLAYYKSLFRGALPREPNQVWNELACLVADLLAVELIDDLRQAYADDLVDPGYATLNELLNDMEREPVQPPPQSRKVYDLIDDVVSEMSWWAAFDPEETPRHEQSSGRLCPSPSLAGTSLVSVAAEKSTRSAVSPSTRRPRDSRPPRIP
jgi:hypothetical protein